MNNECIKLVEKTLEINQLQRRLICHQLKNNENDLALLNEGWIGDILHGGLDLIGMIPGIGVPFDIINGLVYIAEGDFVNAGLSFVGSIPFVGSALKISGRAAVMGGKLFQKAGLNPNETLTKIGNKKNELNAMAMKLIKANDSIKIVKKLGNNAKEKIKTTTTNLLSKAEKTTNELSKGTKAMGSELINKGSALKNQIGSKVSSEINDLIKKGSAFKNQIGSKVSSEINDLTKKGSTLKTQVSSEVSDLIKKGSSLKNKAVTKSLELGKTALREFRVDMAHGGLKTMVIGGSVVLIATLLWYMKPILKSIYEGFKTAIKYAGYLSSALANSIKAMFHKFVSWFSTNEKYAIDPNKLAHIKI